MFLSRLNQTFKEIQMNLSEELKGYGINGKALERVLE